MPHLGIKLINLDSQIVTGSDNVSVTSNGKIVTDASSINSAAFSNYFGRVADAAANADVSLDGGGEDPLKKYNGPSVAVGEVVNELPEVILSPVTNTNSSNNQNNISKGAAGFLMTLGVKNELIDFAGKGGDLSTGTMKYLKYSKGLGYLGAGINTTSAIIQYGQNPTAGNATRIAVQGLAIGTAFIPGVGWVISLGISGAVMIWGDQFYEWIDNH